MSLRHDRIIIAVEDSAFKKSADRNWRRVGSQRPGSILAEKDNLVLSMPPYFIRILQ